MAVQSSEALRLQIEQKNATKNQRCANTVRSPSRNNNNEIEFDTLRLLQLAIRAAYLIVCRFSPLNSLFYSMDGYKLVETIPSWCKHIYFRHFILKTGTNCRESTRSDDLYHWHTSPALCINISFAFLSMTGFVRLWAHLRFHLIETHDPNPNFIGNRIF